MQRCARMLIPSPVRCVTKKIRHVYLKSISITSEISSGRQMSMRNYRVRDDGSLMTFDLGINNVVRSEEFHFFHRDSAGKRVGW